MVLNERYAQNLFSFLVSAHLDDGDCDLARAMISSRVKVCCAVDLVMVNEKQQKRKPATKILFISQ